MNKTPLFFLRAEYNEYVNDCKERGERPLNFKDWHNVAYYYDYQDSLEY